MIAISRPTYDPLSNYPALGLPEVCPRRQRHHRKSDEHGRSPAPLTRDAHERGPSCHGHSARPLSGREKYHVVMGPHFGVQDEVGVEP
jgi:hypothetical protein